MPDELLVPTALELGAGRAAVLARLAALLNARLDAETAGKIFKTEWK